MSEQHNLAAVPIINLSIESEDFRSKIIEFLIENSIDFNRTFLNGKEGTKKTSFNAMIRIFNINKHSLTPKKIPKHIRASIYQNLFSHKTSDKTKKEISKNKSISPKKKTKSVKKIIKPNVLSLEKPKTFRKIRPSIYSNLVQRHFTKIVSEKKNFKELNKNFKTPEKKKSSNRSTSDGNSRIRSLSSQKKTVKILDNPTKYQDVVDDSQVLNENEKTKIKICKSKNKNKTSSAKPESFQSRFPIKKQDKITTDKIKHAYMDKNNDKIIQKPKNCNNKNTSEKNGSIEAPSFSISVINRRNDDILNKTHELKKNDYSFSVPNSDEELKELCEKMKPKSGFHEKISNETPLTYEINQKDIIFSDEIPYYNNKNLEESNEFNKTSIDNKVLVEKFDTALKTLDRQKNLKINKNPIEMKFDEEFKKTLRENIVEIEKNEINCKPGTTNKNFEKMLNRFFVGMEFLSTQERLYYHKFIVKRAKILYVNFLKKRGLINY